MKILVSLISLIFLSLLTPVFAEKSTYQYSIDEHHFDLEYEFGGKILAMQIDHELRSFLIGIENTKEGTFMIKLPKEVISVDNGMFVILVDGYETEYSFDSLGDFNVITISVYEGTQEIEIIGTKVIPEFPIGVMLILFITVSTVVLFGKNQILFRS